MDGQLFHFRFPLCKWCLSIDATGTLIIGENKRYCVLVASPTVSPLAIFDLISYAYSTTMNYNFSFLATHNLRLAHPCKTGFPSSAHYYATTSDDSNLSPNLIIPTITIDPGSRKFESVSEGEAPITWYEVNKIK